MMSDMIVIPGPASRELGKLVASELGVEPHPADHRIFPDGESYIRLTAPVQDETVILVQTTAPAPDQKLLQLLMMAGTANDLGADGIVCVVPYLAYSRQDKRFMEGEALSLDVVVGLLESLGVGDMIVVDAHSEESLRMIEVRHDVNVVNLSAIPLLAEELLRRGFGGAYSLSPDEGAIHLAKAGSVVLGGDSGFFEKRRDRRTGEIEMRVRDLDIGGGRAVVFDDIISSGGTMARAVEGLKAQGAEKVAAACTHALFMEGAKERIEKAGADLIIASDTVHKGICDVTVTVAPLIAESLRELISN
jgi:ribose-phosphate pyrophosphokinase